jgi:glutaminyl-peptide cyclotransferase
VGCLGAIATVLLASPQIERNVPTTTQQVLAFDKAKAWEQLVKQCSFGTRNAESDGYKKCKGYLYEEVKKNCDNVRFQDLKHRWTVTNKYVAMSNIIGEQNWKDAKTRILLIAHWDTRPTSDMDSEENYKLPILGANDGASGVAVLLELMRAMKGRLPKEVGVMYLLTDGEDLGPDLEEMFIGAKAFVADMPNPKPNYGILLDMIGDKDLRVPMEPNSLRYAGPLVKEFYLNAAKNGLRETFPMVYGPVIEDDHICMNESGLPVIDLIDFDYKPWHTQRDTVDKCSADSLGKIGKALETWLLKEPAFTMPK